MSARRHGASGGHAEPDQSDPSDPADLGDRLTRIGRAEYEHGEQGDERRYDEEAAAAGDGLVGS
jgi:hypothetical protein